MAKLQLKRSKEEGLKPSILAEGEPAVNLKDKILYIGMDNGEVVGINAGLPHRTKLKLDTKLKIGQDEGVVVPERYEVTENGELTIEDGGVFIVIDDSDEEGKIYAYDSQRLGNIPAEDYFDYLNPQRFNSLHEAINAIGSANKDLLIKGNVVVDADLTIPENINLVFTRNGKITVNSGVTLTINGGIQAGLWQIFDGDGEVTGDPKIEVVYPEWFQGIDVGDKIVKAAKFVRQYGIVVISSHIWDGASYSTPIDLPKPVYLKFPGVRSKANFLGPNFALRLRHLAGCVVDGFAVTLEGNQNSDVDGVVVVESHDNVFVNGLCIQNSPRDGLVIDGGEASGAYQNVFRGVVRISGSGRNNIRITKSGTGQNPNCTSFYRVVLGSCGQESLLVEHGIGTTFHDVYIQSGSSWAVKNTSTYPLYFDYLAIDSDMSYGISTSSGIFCGILFNNASVKKFDDGSEGKIVYSFQGQLLGRVLARDVALQNAVDDYFMSEVPYVFSTSGEGNSYPFTEWGNLVLESRAGENKRDVVIVNDGAISAVFDRYRNVNIYRRIRNTNIVTFSDGDTTPSVADSNIFKTNNSSATSITTFDDGLAGQEITVIFGDSNTTIVHGSGIYLKGGANVTPSVNTTMKFVYDGTYWYEV